MILKGNELTAKQKNDFRGTSRKKTCARGSIDLSALSKGIYLLQYSDKEIVTTKKIVKQ